MSSRVHISASTWSRRRETSGCTFTVRLGASDARALEDPFRWGGQASMGLVGSVRSAWAELLSVKARDRCS
jgi:hypothetical protein